MCISIAKIKIVPNKSTFYHSLKSRLFNATCFRKCLTIFKNYNYFSFLMILESNTCCKNKTTLYSTFQTQGCHKAQLADMFARC